MNITNDSLEIRRTQLKEEINNLYKARLASNLTPQARQNIQKRIGQIEKEISEINGTDQHCEDDVCLSCGS